MAHRFTSSLRRTAARAGVALLLTGLLIPAAFAASHGGGNPFDKLAGYWAGGGTVTPVRGSPEKVSCRVTYDVKGPKVTQNLRCAGTDYKFYATSNLTYAAGRIKGSWTETTYDASGGVTGSASDNTIHALISGDKFSGRMSIAIAGNRHTINIMQLDPRSGRYEHVASVVLRR
jgi:hypothetical protein